MIYIGDIYRANPDIRGFAIVRYTNLLLTYTLALLLCVHAYVLYCYVCSYVRAEVLAGFVNGLFLVFISFFIFSEAVEVMWTFKMFSAENKSYVQSINQSIHL